MTQNHVAHLIRKAIDGGAAILHLVFADETVEDLNLELGRVCLGRDACPTFAYTFCNSHKVVVETYFFDKIVSVTFW